MNYFSPHIIVPIETYKNLFLQIGLQNAIILLFANEMLLTSFYSCSIVVLLGFIVFFTHFSSRPQNEWLKLRNMVIYGVLIGAATFLLRFCVAILIGSNDDVSISILF